MARAGGILTFLMIGAVVLGTLLGMFARQSPVMAVVAGILYLVAFALWFVVMIALKVNFAQNGYPRGGGIIWTTIALTILMVVVGIAGGIVVAGQVPQTPQPDPMVVLRALGIWGVIIGVMVIAMQFMFLMLGVRLSEYSAVGGGVWKGAGIVLIIAASLGLLITLIYVVTLLTEVWGLFILAGILGVIGMLLWAVVWLLIGIGFMGDANRMAMAGGPARR